MSVDDKYIGPVLRKIIAHPVDMMYIAGFDKKPILVHRSVLQASSKYFDALLGPKFKEGTVDSVTLNGIDGITLRAIVDYCYNGHIEISADNADDILDAASSMEFPAIEEMVGRFWWSQMGIENCIEILEKAEQYCLMDLWQKALQFYGANFHKLPLDEMLNVGERILRKMLAFDEIAVTEEQIFDFVVKWVQRNEEERAEFVPAILKLIRLKHFTSKFLRETIAPFYHKYDCIELVIDEERIRWSECRNHIGLHRFTPANIFCACLTTSVVDNPQIIIKTFDFNQNKWMHLKAINLSMMEDAAPAVIANGKIFFIRFVAQWHFNSMVSSYDMITFQNKRSRCIAADYRESFVPVAVGGYIYVFGGRGANKADLSSCERFDTKSGKWERSNSMPVPTQIDAALELNGKIYAVRKDSLYCYDPVSDEWTTKSPNGAMTTSAVFSLYKSSEYLYMVEQNGKTHQYDPLKNTWKMDGSHLNVRSKILCTIQHHGMTYTLRQDGSFASDKLETDGSMTTLSKIDDARISKSSFAALVAVDK